MAAHKLAQSVDESSLPPVVQQTTTATDDTSLADFTKLYRHLSQNLPLNLSLQHGTHFAAIALQNGIFDTLAGIGWRGREKQLFAKRVVGIIENDDFVAQASDAIGLPQKDETEDEYVERGKAVFKRLLLSTLKDS